MFWLLLVLLFIVVVVPVINFFITGRHFTKKIKKIYGEKELIDKEQTPQMRVNEITNKKIKKVKKAVGEYIDEANRATDNPILWFLLRPIEKIINKFPKENLRKEEILLVKSNNGYWTCPSCNEKNKEIQDVCSNCGQEVEKKDE